jgi:hypothetical protein
LARPFGYLCDVRSPERLLDLSRGQRSIVARSYPRGDMSTESTFFQAIDQPSHIFPFSSHPFEKFSQDTPV